MIGVKCDVFIVVLTFLQQGLARGAPVRKVDIQQVENRITCSSEGIYPEPQLTWSTNPPSNMTLQNKTTVHQTEQQLYNINSYLIVSVTDLVFSCTVSTRRNRRRASLFNSTSISGLGTETTIPCTSSNTSQTGLIWRFNYSQIILKQTSTNISYTVSEEWRQQVKSVSESGSLTLQDLSSSQEGIYTCELSDEEETYVTNTLLKIGEDKQTHTGIAVGVIGAILVVVIGLAVLLYQQKNAERPQVRQEQETHELGNSQTAKTERQKTLKTLTGEVQQEMQGDYMDGATSCLKNGPQTHLTAWKKTSVKLKCDCIK